MKRKLSAAILAALAALALACDPPPAKPTHWGARGTVLDVQFDLRCDSQWGRVGPCYSFLFHQDHGPMWWTYDVYGPLPVWKGFHGRILVTDHGYQDQPRFGPWPNVTIDQAVQE